MTRRESLFLLDVTMPPVVRFSVEHILEPFLQASTQADPQGEP